MADDQIYPTHFMDNSRGLKNLVLAWTLRFNDVLDGDKLHDALWRLFEIGDWRKLGGRLRVGKGRKLEMHVPQTFTKNRPPVAYTKEAFDVLIAEDSLAKHLPSPTERPSLQRPASDFRSLSVRPDAPSTIKELVSRDIPQVSLHVVTFKDATLVSIAWPHVLMDGMSLQGLLRAWSLVLAGKDDQVPALLGAKDDVLYAAAQDAAPGDEWVLRHTILTGLRFLLFVVQFLWSVLTERTVECRAICLPKSAMATLRRQALDEAAVAKPGQGSDPWISEGDVIMAWGIRMTALAQPSPRPVNGMGALDMRSRIPEFTNSKGVYIQNLVIGSSVQLSKDDARQPLGVIASRCREALATQATAPQLRSFLFALRTVWDAGKDPILLPGAWNGELFTISNWTKGNFVNLLDFSPAVIKTGQADDARTNPSGTMIYHQFFVLGHDATLRNVIAVLGKDRLDNYWMMGYFPTRTWAVIEKEMEKMGETGGAMSTDGHMCHG
ncbi:Chloramphenicol acetyltransferase-like domain protein [Metarhizium album ARSEF 1941]|uniref:Chloramphenicol acetyltransferase-like domain protein n=1 Tax=Metarhizium album (strain ARSEF 1941) TaxID=1081103 RepID=A0A0B2WNH4_METAS|nr:Chloramphenicol acetyltransferase-like domain protein [Metarhizium album ARSEF 1941]KHN95518.1 Chloramphenicol acetyltransferase-like domain protein [Metarhizium album ARSEF 1941]